MESNTTNSENSDVSSSEIELFTCTFHGCPKTFTKRKQLRKHLKRHSGERPFICDVDDCSKTYTNSSHLQRHKKRKHTEQPERILCPIAGCGKELTKYYLKKHINHWHDPQKSYPFMCNECQQGFYRKKDLQQHTYLHTGELPFRCEECDRRFMTIREKNRHKRTHTKYTCECGDVFERWNTLLAHKKVCKLINFRCSVCDKNFSNRANLKMHIDTHLNIDDRQVFVCPYSDCERYYLYKTNLRVHINSFHEKIAKPKIPCTYEGCNKLLSRMSVYKKHLKTHEITNKPRLPRKPRKDKGIPKKKAINELVSVPSQTTRDISCNNK